jgi:hypothetical protein
MFFEKFQILTEKRGRLCRLLAPWGLVFFMFTRWAKDSVAERQRERGKEYGLHDGLVLSPRRNAGKERLGNGWEMLSACLGCKSRFISRLARADPVLTSPHMTRSSISRTVKIFLVALILTFVWTVFQVAAMVGLL